LREALVSLAKSEMADLGRLMEEAIAAGDRDTILAAVARHVDARGRALESIRNLLALDLAELRTGGAR
jgi:hypothetical protein